MLAATMVAAEYYHDLLIREKDANATIALKYLTKRGIGSEIIKKFHIGIAPKAYTVLYDELKKDFSNEILEKADLLNRYKWALDDAEINKKNIHLMITPKVLMHQLNAFCDILDWDLNEPIK